jgi:hypothetical protein
VGGSPIPVYLNLKSVSSGGSTKVTHSHQYPIVIGWRPAANVIKLFTTVITSLMV